MLEIPTSTFLLPLASPAFATLRRRGSELLLRLLALEAGKSPEMVLVLSFDTQDFHSDRAFPQVVRRLSHLVPTASGGFQLRYWLRTYDPREIFSTTVAIFDQLANERFVRLSDIKSQMDELPGNAMRQNEKGAQALLAR